MPPTSQGQPGETCARRSGRSRVRATEPERDMPSSRRDIVIAGVLLSALAIIPFLPSLHGGFLWDDNAHVTANPTVVGPQGLSEIWTTSAANYFPFVLTTFRAIHAVAGLNPTAYHAASLFFHAIAALLLWRVLATLSEGSSRDHAQPSVAWFGAVLWAVHPVQVESVAWISELKNTESAVFYFAAVLLWLKWLIAQRACPRPLPSKHYWAALGCGLLALLSKPSTVMLPVALALAAWWLTPETKSELEPIHGDPVASQRRYWAMARALLPFALLSLAAALWAIWEQKFHQHALGPEWNQTVAERLEIAGRAIWFYLGKLCWPTPLVFIYPRWSLVGIGVAAVLPLIAALGALAGLWRWRTTTGRTAFFAFGYFVVLLFPILGLFTVYYFRYSFVADHFQYLASAGPLALLAGGIITVGQRLPQRIRLGIPALLLSALVAGSWRQSENYRDGATLYRSILAANPSCWLAHNNLARLLTEQGRLDEAIEHCRSSLQLHPSSVAHFNLAAALMAKGDSELAVGEYRAAIALEPGLLEAYNNLGVLLATLGRADEAIDVYQRAIVIDPKAAQTHANWGLLLAARGDLPGAISHYQQAIELDPHAPDPFDYKGVALVRLHRYDDALIAFRAALDADPTYTPAIHHLDQVGQLIRK